MRVSGHGLDDGSREDAVAVEKGEIVESERFLLRAITINEQSSNSDSKMPMGGFEVLAKWG